ncbi:TLC domain-containing protein 4 [Hemicordylus capensis]|uniref:TLC domain-containing protein 4 n=1 Tax=Hemicordylus capensis TaxID=884348 RepID=UPI002304A79E|nr:TLC domain-containing protein 4 [Hemicordylus capensis]XP_053105862.1 TLC domain-containing protein 4 [Hemicordylus capensis]XP_053105863.1 TLC domain-containing protein 4 [Hemicordylus capensis]XP_053105864.1 TLC domain-containing protein 4 [Hemicordylus capensis]XP_053105865.1 TLC domain-containing protein 4 [Hemicordylus capensis]XP_053105867.1 TLC domain-containing protein 4 [Hemicordylus capensis]XP_053105868.1 TLC domain-containing protein 4 [Hemicordylus capensis]XP_053105869.1 TLC
MMAAFDKLIWGLGISSFAIFQLLFHVLSSWVSARLTAGFNNLDQKKKIEWNSRTVSTFHALVVGGFCLYILLYDEAVNTDRVWGDPSLVKLNLAITTGYLISDLLLIIFYWKAIGDIFYVIHHLVALYAYYFVLGRGLLAYFANFRLLAELSTPLVNQRWFFDMLGYPKSSKANIINGILMTVLFFLVRIAVIPIYYGNVISEFGTESFHRLGFAAQSAWFISSIVLDIMNLMWMVKITKGCYKVICLIGKGGSKAHKNGKSD